MPTEVKLPNLGDGVDSGDVLDVLVKEGDVIAKDQGILEIETGKATIQVPSNQAGKVVKVHVANIFRALKVNNRTAAAAAAQKLGLLR